MIFCILCISKELAGADGAQVMRITGNVFNLLVMINCAANFILYSALSTKFRATFSQLFCTCVTVDPPCRRCRCWPGVYADSSTSSRDINPDTSVTTGRYTSLPDRVPTAARQPGRGRSSTASTSISDDEGLCSTRHTATTDRLVMSGGQSGIEEEDPDDLHITSL